MHPPLPSSINSSTVRMTRTYPSERQGKASGRAPTWRAFIVRNQGCSPSTPRREKVHQPFLAAEPVRLVDVRWARRARFECGVRAAKAGATRLRCGVEATDVGRLRFFNGVWGIPASPASSGSKEMSTLEGSVDDSSLYPPSLLVPESESASSLTRSDDFIRRFFSMGLTATTHGSPEPHPMSFPLARSRDRCGEQPSRVHYTTRAENLH